ncbi:hypothetical protein MSIMFB_00126 [Mycobacterium simulans]|uniref:Secreted protein n=1 Tax=Mycobacterium simulans TaxID=627089 RepID=A0A7Z7N7J4_9MYCO|nr:hypothetical protein [Mycobacterium simulans]SOJ52613.1 hypothetical protein MSIMFB_00126 [Mycobacterium simulans]
MASRIGISSAVCVLAFMALAGLPTAHANPDVALPPIASTGGGPIIGGGDEAAQYRIARQLSSLGNPDVQEGDGADAAAFIMGSAALPSSGANPHLAAAFVPLQRALGCQRDNTSFGARAYRRSDGQWGGAVLVIAKSATSDIEALTTCVKSVWPAPTAGGATSMCASGWTYPTSGENHRPETYYILLAGTDGDFCSTRNESYANYATRWPA